MDAKTQLEFLQTISDLEMHISAKLCDIRRMILSGKAATSGLVLHQNHQNHQNHQQNGVMPTTLPATAPAINLPPLLSTPPPTPSPSPSPPMLARPIISRQQPSSNAATVVNSPADFFVGVNGAPVLQPQPQPPPPQQQQQQTQPLLQPQPQTLPQPPQLPPQQPKQQQPTLLPTSSSPALTPAQPMFEASHEVQFPIIYSLRDFYIHSDWNSVEEFCVRLNKRYGEELAVAGRAEALKCSAIAVKQFVCVRHKADDCFFRSLVLKASGDGGSSYLVRFVDFGDIVTVASADIFHLLEEFRAQPAMAVHCYVDGKWDQDTALFDSMMRNFSNFPEPVDHFEAARVTVHRSLDGTDKFPATVTVKTHAGLSWKELLEVPLSPTSVVLNESLEKQLFNLTNFTSAYLKEANLNRSPAGYLMMLSSFPGTAMLKMGEPGYCAHCPLVACVSRFALVLEGAVELVTNMSHYYRCYQEATFVGSGAGGGQSVLRERNLIVFSLADSRFYFRGLITDIRRPGEAEVYAVDLGFSAAVPNSAILPLLAGETWSLGRIPPKAVIAGLEKIVPMHPNSNGNGQGFGGTRVGGDSGDGEWPPLAVITMKTFAMEKEKVVAVPSGFCAGTYRIELNMANGTKATEMLKRFKLARDA